MADTFDLRATLTGITDGLLALVAGWHDLSGRGLLDPSVKPTVCTMTCHATLSGDVNYSSVADAVSVGKLPGVTLSVVRGGKMQNCASLRVGHLSVKLFRTAIHIAGARNASDIQEALRVIPPSCTISGLRCSMMNVRFMLTPPQSPAVSLHLPRLAAAGLASGFVRSDFEPEKKQKCLILSVAVPSKGTCMVFASSKAVATAPTPEGCLAVMRATAAFIHANPTAVIFPPPGSQTSPQPPKSRLSRAAAAAAAAELAASVPRICHGYLEREFKMVTLSAPASGTAAHGPVGRPVEGPGWRPSVSAPRTMHDERRGGHTD